MRNTTKKLRDHDNTWYLFLLPTILGLLLFTAYPILESFRLSFFKSNGTIEEFIGLQNYTYIFNNDLFWKTVWNTFYITFFQLLIGIPIAYIIACIINELKICKNFIKSLFFIPYITPVVASATVFLFVLHPSGLLNSFIGLFGVEPINWLLYPTTAQWGTIIFSNWQALGFYIIIILANLQSIPTELDKAAQVDGATKIQIWWHITTPLMKGTFRFLIIMGWISGLQRFSDVYVLGGAQGSPARSLFTIVGFIYERGFGSFEFGVASAAAYVLFAIIAIFTIVNMTLTNLKKEQ
ncbi:MAG: sugar ABC transporter permease [Epulopiscium sp. Nele67-Bin002]|nr:MAG: sugar ABC transporter permease [Epulopiscium sp. Nuni2H_MBin001]OON92327.1 MAG: sugar ABC transporter permease [Epulopiscium sp. Nele67-Bin002]